MRNKFVSLKQLDRYFQSLKSSGAEAIPKQGWLRSIRKSLGMTIKQLAKRLGCDPSRVVKIEMDEVVGAVSLRTMSNVASKLNCQFVYQIIPHTNLEEMVRNRARIIATKAIQRTAHTMDLETQSTEKQWLEDQVTDMTYELLQKSWKHLWEE